jgi:hypothetical protein
VWMRTCGICLSVPGLFHLTSRPSVSSISLEMTGFHSFNGWVIFHHVYIPHFKNKSLIHVWTSWLILKFGCCE